MPHLSASPAEEQSFGAKSADNPKKFRPGVQPDVRRSRRNEYAVAFEYLEQGIAAEHRSAAVEEEEYLERFP